MDDFVRVEHVQTLQNAVGEAPHQRQREALEFVLFHKFVQVDTEQFEGDAFMATDKQKHPLTLLSQSTQPHRNVKWSIM